MASAWDDPDDVADPGVIEPGRLFRALPGVPERLVLCFTPEAVSSLLAETGAAPLPGWRTSPGCGPLHVLPGDALPGDTLPSDTLPGDGAPVAIGCPGVGAAAATLMLEQAIARGVREVVVVGGAGGLVDGLDLGVPLVVTDAVRDEGVSGRYLPPGRTVAADPEVTRAITETVAGAGHPVRAVRAWTTDAPYRETAALVARRVEEGCQVVEMEAAALLAVAARRGVRLGVLVFAADSLAGGTWQHRRWLAAAEAHRHLLDLAVAAVRAVRPQPVIAHLVDEGTDLTARTVRRRAVRAVVRRGDRLLMTRSRFGDYGFPGGGLEPGESPAEALRRELAEEVGAQLVSTGELIGVAVQARRSIMPEWDTFVARHEYYPCEISGETRPVVLSGYEADLDLRPCWVEPAVALAANRALDEAFLREFPWALREAAVLEWLLDPGRRGSSGGQHLS